ncbi:MAG: GNAT family N-acetyltransferase [Paracoccaceae bacterium]
MIRQAQAGDVRAVKSCAELAYQKYVHAIGRKPSPMVANFADLIRQGIVYVAIDTTGNIDGFIVFHPVDNSMHLANVAVLPASMGMGIGKALIQYCENSARNQGLARIDLYTNIKMLDNLNIYPHLGYQEVDSRKEDNFHRVFFQKLL